MKNIKFSRLFAAALVVACLAFVGCKPQTEEVTVEKVIVVRQLSAEDSIVGKWKYTNYESQLEYDMAISVNKVEGSFGSHSGNVYIQEVSETSGYIYYKFSDDITGYGPAPDYTPYTIECAGKWCAVAYKNLTADSVQMCDAYKTYDFAESLSAAVVLYTVDNGWFGGINTPLARVE